MGTREVRMGSAEGNDELHSLYRSPNMVRVNKSTILTWAGHVVRMEEGRSAFKILTVKSTGNKILREAYVKLGGQY